MKSLPLISILTLTLLIAFTASAASKHHFATNTITEIDQGNSHVCHMETVYHLTENLKGGSRFSTKTLVWNNFTNSPLLCDQYNEYEQCLDSARNITGFSLEKGKECFRMLMQVRSFYKK